MHDGGPTARRLLAPLLLACLAVIDGGITLAADWPPLSPQPSRSVEHASVFPSASEAGQILGMDVEAAGPRTDLGQLWEHVELEPQAVMDAQIQVYRPRANGDAHASAGSSVEIVWFRSSAEASAGGSAVAESVTSMLEGFATDISADLVAAGTWSPQDGSGGSVILVRDGQVVIIVSTAGASSAESEAASTALTALVLERIGTSRLAGAPGQPPAAEPSPAVDW